MSTNDTLACIACLSSFVGAPLCAMLGSLPDEIDYDGTTGFCLACGAEQCGCEPDMRAGTCEACNAPKVYGLEELAAMGLVKVLS